MQTRYVSDNISYRRMTTEELRSAFLVDSLFNKNKIDLIYTNVDRAIVGSAVPAEGALRLSASKKEMAAEYFAERRELGIINIGGDGSVTADGVEFNMNNKDALYIGKGTKDIVFKSKAAAEPAKFYMASYPAHAAYPTTLIKNSDADASKLGDIQNSNKRTIYKFIHPSGVKSCQLVMGLTELEEGSVWNTMPPHTHMRRTEIYLYFGLAEDACAFHFMGEEKETRHLVIRNEQAVIAPSWSIHSAAGTKNYSFIWAMGGENQAFDDMDFIPVKEIL